MTGNHDDHGWSLSGSGAALVSALLFGVTTPLAKQLLTGANPLLIAGLLYAGSGLGLTLMILFQDRGHFTLGLARRDRQQRLVLGERGHSGLWKEKLGPEEGG